MSLSDAIHAGERHQPIVDTLSELPPPHAPADSPETSPAAATTQQPTGESSLTNGGAVQLPAVSGPSKDASVSRLACLHRHWTWADEAMAQFDRELAVAWEYDEDPFADHPFGAYYHWCALLCGISEAALEHGLLSASQLDALRPDLEASLPVLRACRQLLVVIPASLEEQPHVVDLLRDDESLARVRRIHDTMGEALRRGQLSRELDLLLYEH